MLCSACPQEWAASGDGFQGCLDVRNGHLDLLSRDSFQTMWDRKAVCRELGLVFFSLLCPASLNSHLTGEYPDTHSCTLVSVWRLAGFTKLENSNLTCEPWQSNPSIQKRKFWIYMLCCLADIHIESSTKTDVQHWIKMVAAISLEPFCPFQSGCLSTLYNFIAKMKNSWCLNEYIYGHKRAAVIKSVFRGDKAGSMWLCLRGNCWNRGPDARNSLRFNSSLKVKQQTHFEGGIKKKKENLQMWSSHCWGLFSLQLFFFCTVTAETYYSFNYSESNSQS